MTSSFALRTVKTLYNVQQKEWSAPLSLPIYNPNVSIGQLVIAALSAKPDGVAQICHDDGHLMKNWEILRDSVRVALNMQRWGLQEVHVLGLAASNSRHVASVVFGALLNGYPVSTVNPQFEASDVSNIFGITEQKVVFCDKRNYSHVKEALKILNNKAQIYVFSDTLGSEYLSVQELLKAHPDDRDFLAPYISDGLKLPAFILCSSGTTGAPKAIAISHASLAYQSDFGNLRSFFGFSSLYWYSGVMVLLQSTICNVPRVIMSRGFVPELGLEIIRKHQIEFLFCTPAQIQMMLGHPSYKEGDLSSLKVVLCGGSAAPECLIREAPVPLINLYGCTEVLEVSRMGQLCNSCVVKIVDDQGDRLGTGECGEICVKARVPILGYYNNPEATKAIYRDGFVHTGDMGYFDRNGTLHYVDRKKDIFKYNNFHVSPTEIERVLLTMDGVSLVCVVGLEDRIYGSLPAAIIVRRGDVLVEEEDVHRFAKENLGQHNWLRGGVYFLEELPFTASGKIIRREVKEIASELYRNRGSDNRFIY